jgi:superfamily II DNA or RNA helicase
MRQGHLITMPPGSGKTRVTLQLIFKLYKGNSISALNNLLILGPNKKVERVWLREINIHLKNLKKKIEKKEEESLKNMSTISLKRELKESNVQIKFMTYGEIKKRRSIAASPYIILDEWHRFNVYDKSIEYKAVRAKAHILSHSAKGRMGNHTFFVSATPLNPVLESEVEVMSDKLEDDEKLITESRRKALYSMAYLLDNKIGDDLINLPFIKAIKILKIQWHHKNTDWKRPEILSSNKESGLCKYYPSDLEYIKNTQDQNNTNWISQEAAWAVGLLSTEKVKKNGDIKFNIRLNKRGNKNSFGKHYVNLFSPGQLRKNYDAGKWLIEKHSRVYRLIEILKEKKVITENISDKKYTLTKNAKVLIFCVHQGVALGLEYALRQFIDNSEKQNIACAVHEFDELKENAFNEENSAPYILIATDKMSESIDLHKACRTVVHYELPWSPLRLLQRVGRLTRYNNGIFDSTYVYHIIIPGSVEEEKVNRLMRRTALLAKEGAWPKELFEGKEDNWLDISKCLIGKGPSRHLMESWE